MTLRTRNPSGLSQPGLFTPREVIFDPRDNRVAVNNPTQSPYSSICAIDAFASGADNPTRYGTGWIIAPRVVVTAAHVIYDPAEISDSGFGNDQTGSPELIHVTPALTGSDAPFGQYSAHESMIHPIYRESGSIDFDVGVILLEEPVDSSLEPFIIEPRSDDQLIDNEALVAGFPLDIQDGQIMVEAREKIIDVEPQRIFHKVDTENGQRGAPLWIEDNTSHPIVVGLQTRGFSERPPSIGLANTATRFNNTLVNWLQNFL